MIWPELSIGLKKVRCAAIFAAHFVCVGASFAQNVTFRSDDNAVTVAGRFVGFDGDVVTLAAETGPVAFQSDGMICEGGGCPDLENYIPRLRMTGAPRMADVLLPSLIDVFARDNGWAVREDSAGFDVVRADGTIAIQISLSVAPSGSAYETFLAQDADVFMSMRELQAEELSKAAMRGLGQLNTARQGRILALDALVPVTDAASDRRTISMAELTNALSGRSEVFNVVLSDDYDSQLSGLEERFMLPFGDTIGENIAKLGDLVSVTEYVASTQGSLTVLPYGQTGNTQPLALDGPCGLRSDAAFLTLKTEDYPLTFPMFLYLPQRNLHPAEEEFLAWFRSPSAQLVIRRAGFVDLAAVPIPLSDQGDRLANAITNAGVEVPLGELQRMIRVLSPQVRMSSTFRFEPGSTRLDGQSRSNVLQLAQAIRDGRFGGQKLMFVGFSDGRGPAAANRDLSGARAESVRRDVEAALGGTIPINVVIETEAFGEALPMACDDTIWGQQTNRRVELWVQDTN